MKRILLMFAVAGTFSVMAQEVQEADRLPNFNPENIFRKMQQDRTVTCGLDTCYYLTAKATGTSGLAINNATSASGMAQYFDAPEAITVSGVDFIAVKADATGGTSINVDVEIYNAGADSLPTGTALASALVAVDTNFYGGNLTLLTKSATFSVPTTVTGPYCIVISNNSANSINMYSNDYATFDGAQEWLSSANIGGSWIRSYNVNVGGAVYDADMFMHPYVTYDLTADFSLTPNCQDGGDVTANHMSTGVASNRMYSAAAYAGLEGDQYTWDWGDASATETGVGPMHTYATGTYNVTLTDTIMGWTSNCVESITKSTCDQPATIGENELTFNVYPNPASSLVTFEATEEIALVQIFDMSGKVVYSENTNASKIQIDVDLMANGIYAAKVKLASGAVLNKQLEILK
ncbi:MAG: T9SS type A sorting domain-containing protein [Crocinitomicaceae bacterium]